MTEPGVAVAAAAERLVDKLYPADFCSGLDPTESDVWRYLYRVFVDMDEWSMGQQDRLEGLLQLANRHGQLRSDSVRRLRSPDEEQFWGKLNEFVVASILESKGFKIEFNPPAREGREGEFLLFLNELVFVEVKTMFRRVPEGAEERQLNRLCRAASQVHYPAWIQIAILKAPAKDFRIVRFRDFLRRELPNMARSGQERPSLTFRDPASGLEAVIAFMASLPEGPVEASPSIGPKWLRNHAYIKASLQSAYRQLPSDMPCIVVLCDRLEFPARCRDFYNALYGTLGYLPDEGRAARATDGFLSRGRHRRVSVVAQLDELGERQNPDSELVFYHNPWARRGLEPSALEPISRRHFVLEITQVEGRTRLRICEPYGSTQEGGAQCEG